MHSRHVLRALHSMHVCALCRVDPASGALVKAAGLSAATRIAMRKAAHGRAYAAMTAAFEESKPLADKYKSLVQGYAVRDAKKGNAMRKAMAELEAKEIDLECFLVRSLHAAARSVSLRRAAVCCMHGERRGCPSSVCVGRRRRLAVLQALERQELASVPQRRDALEHAVAAQRKQEAALQLRYKDLTTRLDSLVSHDAQGKPSNEASAMNADPVPGASSMKDVHMEDVGIIDGAAAAKAVAA
jgi:hypothetical protein